MTERSVVVRLKAEIAGFKQAMDEAAQVSKKTGKAAEDVGKRADTGMGQLVQSATKHKEAWSQAGGTMLGFGAAVLVGVGSAIKSYAEFDKQMSTVQAATHATGGEMSQLRDLAIAAGADTSFSAKEAAQGIEELAKAGVSTSDVMKGGLAGALSLAAAGSLDVGKAAEIAATALTQFKLSGDKVPHVADLLAAAAGNAQGSVEDMGMALKQAGLVAASTGLSIEETTGGLAAFASAGLIGSDAGTSFKSMLQRLTPQSAEAANKMAELGISAYDSQGNFIGLAKFADNLKTSMKTLTPEARAAAMGVIFGSDAVRAANVLYEQGADGIRDWTDKVNSSGYAAQTAAIAQNNLAGDVEKLGGSLDSVFLKSAGPANDVLRGLAKGAEDLVDAIGNIPGPILQTILGFSGLVGAGALAVGGFVTLFPKIIETKQAFDKLRDSNVKAANSMERTGKVLGGLAASFAVLEIVGAISKAMGPAAKSAEEYGNAMLTLKDDTKDLDKVVENLGGMGTQIHGVGDALARRVDFNWFDELNNRIGDIAGGTSKTQEIRDSIIGVDETLAGLARNGGAAKAAESFKILAREADESNKATGGQGIAMSDTLKVMPEYTKALQQQALAAGVHLDQYQLLDLALGVIPPAMESAAGATEKYTDASGKSQPVTEEMAKALDEVGLSAQGVIINLDALLQSMFAAGILTQSAADAESAYQEKLDGLKESIDKVKASQSEGNQILDAASGSFDLTTAAGRAANGVFGDLQKSAIATTEAMAKNGATQPELQAKLATTYQSLKDAAVGFGMSETKADDLARSALGIPKNVDINTAIQNYADTLAKAQGLKKAVDDIPTFKDLSIHVNYTESGTAVRDRASSAGMSNMNQAYAEGGIVGYADGGIVHAARGLHRQSMIARGGANIMWAEPETGWEAYISGKPGMEQRNAGILKTIAPRFGLEVTQRSRSFSGGTAYGAAAVTAAPAAAPNVQVFIGAEQLDSRIVRVSGGVLAEADRQSPYKRTGRK